MTGVGVIMCVVCAFSFSEFIQPAITMQGPMLYQALVAKIYDE